MVMSPWEVAKSHDSFGVVIADEAIRLNWGRPHIVDS